MKWTMILLMLVLVGCSSNYVSTGAIVMAEVFEVQCGSTIMFTSSNVTLINEYVDDNLEFFEDGRCVANWVGEIEKD